MRRLYCLVVIALCACGKKDKPAPAAAPVPAVMDAAPVLTGPGYELAEAARTPPPEGSLVGKEPPTAESVHVELSYALARWAANPHDATLYTQDFGGRADSRSEPVGADEWMKQLPATPPKLGSPSIETWLDPGTQLTLGESKALVSYGDNEARALMWRREDGKVQLSSEMPVSANPRAPIDASGLGRDVTARLGTENRFAWLVLENPTGAQVVVDLWPNAPCRRDEPTKLVCNNKQFTLVANGGELTVSPDQTIKLAKDAKLTFK